MAKQVDFDIGYTAKYELELNENSSIKKLKTYGTKQDSDTAQKALQTALPRSVRQLQHVMI
jgi:hypothetical protein